MLKTFSGQYIKIIFRSQILQHLFRIRHQTAFGRNNCEEILRELFSQGLILHSYRLQRIRKTLPVQFILR